MNIQLSTIDSAKNILEIFKECKKKMEKENILQWTESYPNIEIVIQNIDNKELYELSNEAEIFGVICLNVYQYPEYETVDWKAETEEALIIHRLAISPIFQNKGLAKILMTFAEEYALKAGFKSIRLDAYSGNEKALRIYEGLNYKKRGEVNFLGRKIPFFCYEKILR